MSRRGVPLVAGLGLVAGLVGAVTLAAARDFAAEHRQEVESREKLVRERGRVFADGKGHVLVLAVGEISQSIATPQTHGYYGDGKVLYPMGVTAGDVFGRAADGWITGTLDFADARNERSIITVDRDVVVTCGTRQKTFTPVAGGMASLAKATLKPEWGFPRREYLLARDDGTTYFYIDRARDPYNNTDFNVYLGKRGAMKAQKVKDLASDGAGDVFVMPTGTLRIKTVIKRGGSKDFDSGTWTATGKKAVALVFVPLDLELIYGDLGVYTGRRFETPCDDV